MITGTPGAYLVTLAADGIPPQEFVLLGAGLADAAAHAAAHAETTTPPGRRVTSIRRLAPFLPARDASGSSAGAATPTAAAPERGAAAGTDGAARASAKALRPSAKVSKAGAPVPRPPAAGSRAEQIVAPLRVNGGQMHISEIADGLRTNVVNAHNAVGGAAAKGLVRRLGARSGLVALVESLRPSGV